MHFGGKPRRLSPEPKDLSWKPLFFLSQQSQTTRKAGFRFSEPVWVQFCGTVDVIATKAADVFSTLPIHAKNQSEICTLINNYLMDLYPELAVLLYTPINNDWDACREIARIHYCLMRWKRFELIGDHRQIKNKQNNDAGVRKHAYIESLKNQIHRWRCSKEELQKTLESFGSTDNWRPGKKSVGSRNELLDLQKFRALCKDDILTALKIISGDRGRL